MILYEYPFNERIRTYLRLEQLFRRLAELVPRSHPLDHHFAIQTIFEIMDVASRADMKSDVLKDLDSLPFPAWDLIDTERYRAMWVKRHGYYSMNIATTRGCPYHCNWCAKPIWGQRYAMRSPARARASPILV